MENIFLSWNLELNIRIIADHLSRHERIVNTVIRYFDAQLHQNFCSLFSVMLWNQSEMFKESEDNKKTTKSIKKSLCLITYSIDKWVKIFNT